MNIHTTHVRVRYGEVDQMGFLYYGNYALYYETARAEMIRERGYTYAQLERDGIVMPVVKMTSKFLRPALYDELIRIETSMEVLEGASFICFKHKLYNEENILLNKAEVVLTFFDPTTQKRTTIPEHIKHVFAY